MDLARDYFERAEDIIGVRTPAEERYDREVLRWLAKGKAIAKAIAKANEKFPAEALAIDASMENDLRARYDYLAEHERITRMLHR